MADDFKAHSPIGGPKLAASQAAGMPGLARRVERARALAREAELKRRERAGGGLARLGGEAAGADRGGTDENPLDRSAGRPAPAVGEDSTGGVGAEGGGEQGTRGDGAAVKMGEALSPAKSGRKGGRPRKVEGEPWVAEGVSRRTWERRRKA